MYAIIETGGKQVRVEVGSKIYVEKLDAEEKSLPKSRNKEKAKKFASSSTRARQTNIRPLVIVNLILA